MTGQMNSIDAMCERRQAQDSNYSINIDKVSYNIYIYNMYVCCMLCVWQAWVSMFHSSKWNVLYARVSDTVAAMPTGIPRQG